MNSVSCNLPPMSRIGQYLPGFSYIDSFAIPGTATEQPIATVYVGVLGHLSAWFKRLLILRTRLVAPFGLLGPTLSDLNAVARTPRTYAVGEKILRWTIYDLREDEIITGLDDKHLNFRVSVMRDRKTSPPRIVLSTAVKTHNRFGKAYLATIKPFHRFGVKTLLNNAAAAGRL